VEAEGTARILHSISLKKRKLDAVAYLGLQDLEKRWTAYSRQGVHKLSRRNDFPPPCFALNNGKTKVWTLPDIEASERERPELRDNARKILKVKGFLRALHKGPQPTG
jgi:hypothetical protein